MPIRDIPISRNDLCLPPDACLKDALDLMLARQMDHVAICRADGRFVGLLSTNAIIDALVPASARMVGGLSDLSFTGDALRLLTAHLHDLGGLPVSRFADQEVRTMHEGAPILEAAKLLSEIGTPLPVVSDDGRFLGVLTLRDLLGHIVANEGGA